ncbi:MAG: FecR domain-containing protein [Deltaproteobacteria bacterium]|nr:FecR domain-containing protein [Deltaproteobacteria bacterium]
MHDRRVIERYLSEGLAPDAEARLRAHLRGCVSCRSWYDQQVLLLRALAGRPDSPTVREERRAERLALAAIAPRAEPTSQRSWGVWPVLRDGVGVLRLRGRPWRVVAIAVAAVLLMVGIVGELVLRPAPPVHAARVVRATGLAVDAKPAQRGGEVNAGSLIQVGAKGFAELAVERGGLVRLYPNTSATLDGGGEGVNLGAGKVWCLVDRDRGVFIVRTDRGQARVLGTSFVVEKLSKGDMEVRVMAGSVAVEDTGHRGERVVTAGQKTLVARDAAPSPPSAYSGEVDSEEWGLLEFFKAIGRAFKGAFESIFER